jgi:hypothetical protein
MQGQPGFKAVDTYEFLGELVTALCETPDFTTAAQETRRHTIKLMLEKIARVEEVEWLACQHYREYLPNQLVELYATVFNKTVNDGEQNSIHVFNAARRPSRTIYGWP